MSTYAVSTQKSEVQGTQGHPAVGKAATPYKKDLMWLFFHHMKMPTSSEEKQESIQDLKQILEKLNSSSDKECFTQEIARLKLLIDECAGKSPWNAAVKTYILFRTTLTLCYFVNIGLSLKRS
jgi:hypothetical protein